MARTRSPQPARPEDLAPAFRLMFRQLPAEDREPRLANALHLVSCGELERDGVLVVHGRRELLGALVCVPLRGASGLVWPPQVVDGPFREEIENQLVEGARTWLRQRGAKLAQALVPVEEASQAAPLLRNGFARVTRLQYLRHDLENLGGLILNAAEPSLSYLPYRAETVARFHQTLLRTYENTLDCPELNGVRTLDEIIEGHQAQGVHDPDRWWLAEEAGRPIGVVLMTDVPDLGGWDLSYVGVVPEARGRGIGGALTRTALREARVAAAERMILAVDARNHPAWTMYRRLGFEPTEEREVYLTFFS